jgi:hypothetical protein
MIKLMVLLITCFFIGGCSLFLVNTKGECVSSYCDSDEMGKMIYDDESIILIYKGSFNDKRTYEGQGSFYYHDNSKLDAISKDGFVTSGVYYYTKEGVQYTINFSEELLDPEMIKKYKFINKIQQEKVSGNFSYTGEMDSLTLQGKGTLFKDDLFFDGNFKDKKFKGIISNNVQTKKFEISSSDNSVKYEYKDGKKKNVLQGRIKDSIFKGSQTRYDNKQEIINYKGEWKLAYSPFDYDSFKFEDFKKNGLYTSKIHNKIFKGDFKDDKKYGHFEVYKSKRLMGFDYYKENKKLYYIPLYLEIQSQLQKNDCKYTFPETINLWTPYKYKSCEDDIYTIEFTDKENKNLLMEMVYDKVEDTVKSLVVYDQDKRYNFEKVNTKKILNATEYTLRGVAKIYEWVDDRYILINTSEIDINSFKK